MEWAMLRLRMVLLILFWGMVGVACGGERVSPRKIDSFRILGVKLSPPVVEMSGGDIIVEALVVDEDGLVADSATLMWIVSDSANVKDQEVSKPIAVGFGNHTKISVPEAGSNDVWFVSLIASKKPLSPDDFKSESGLFSLVGSDDVKIAIRTLPVSEQISQNPVIESFRLTLPDDSTLTVLDGGTVDLAYGSKVSAGDAVEIEVTVDDSELVDDVAWFSTVDGLRNHRILENSWPVPELDDDSKLEYPVWVVVRGEGNGQTWAGFIIRLNRDAGI